MIDGEEAHEAARSFAGFHLALKLVRGFRRRQQRWKSSFFNGSRGRLKGPNDFLERSIADVFVMMHRQRSFETDRYSKSTFSPR